MPLGCDVAELLDLLRHLAVRRYPRSSSLRINQPSTRFRGMAKRVLPNTAARICFLPSVKMYPAILIGRCINLLPCVWVLDRGPVVLSPKRMSSRSIWLIRAEFGNLRFMSFVACFSARHVLILVPEMLDLSGLVNEARVGVLAWTHQRYFSKISCTILLAVLLAAAKNR